MTRLGLAKASVVGVLSAGLTTGLAGCHHRSKVAVSSPPPPITVAKRRPAPIERTPATAPEPSPAVPPARGPANSGASLGRPVSVELGLASWYGPPYHNRQAADGSIFDQNALTAAHRELPMGTTVRVTNLATNQSVVARITDRGPFVEGRTLDLSLAAAKEIGVYRAGVAKVRIEIFAHPGADPEGRWCVQIGAFLEQADAVQTRNDLIRRYPTAKVIEFAGPTGFWVRINPVVARRGTAESIAAAIHVPDAEAWLVRLN